VPGFGPVAATTDLDLAGGGTSIRLRWAYLGDPPADAAEVERIRADKEAAFGRLASIVDGSLPVAEQTEVGSR
jgi:hypothetical protein